MMIKPKNGEWWMCHTHSNEHNGVDRPLLKYGNLWLVCDDNRLSLCFTVRPLFKMVAKKPEPQKQFKYERVEFDRASSALMSWEEFHAGNEAYHLYIKVDDKFVEPDIYQVVGNYENLYRKVEIDPEADLYEDFCKLFEERRSVADLTIVEADALHICAKHAIEKYGVK